MYRNCLITDADWKKPKTVDVTHTKIINHDKKPIQELKSYTFQILFSTENHQRSQKIEAKKTDQLEMMTTATFIKWDSWEALLNF